MWRFLPTGKIHPMQNATKNFLLIVLSGLALAAPMVAKATCWDAASESYGIPVDVLKAVAKTESCFSSCVEWQLGHSGTVSERTRASNSLPQD